MSQHEAEASERSTMDLGLSAGDRRSFLKKAGIAGAAVWAAPTLLSTAAAAQGTPLCQPEPVANNQQRQTNLASGQSASVILPGTNQAQLAVAMVPLNDVTAATQVNVSGSGWSLLVNKEVSSGSGDRLAMWVWGRTTNLQPGFTFTLSGAAADAWRVLGTEFTNVYAIGTAAAQGDPATTTITAPSVNVPANSNGVAWWIGATRTDLGAFGFFPPSGYNQATGEFQNAPNLQTGFANFPGPATVPAASTTIPATADVVGAQIPLLCTF